MESIRKVTEQVVTAMNEGDIESFFAVISDDAVFFPPTEPPKSGNELRDSIYICICHAHHTAYISNYPFGHHCAESYNLGHILFAVL